MKRLQLGLIGSGRAGLIHGANIARRIDRADLAAVCDANPDNLRAAAAELGCPRTFADFREVCADPAIDAVVIVTPTFLHAEIACAAATAGKHVFLEKPMAVTADECRAIEEACETAGVKLQIGFMRRFDDGFRRAKAVLDSGTLGRVMIIKSTGRGPGGPGPWMWDLKKSNGIVAEVNSHDLDSIHWFTGAGVRHAYAEAHNFKMPEARERFPDFYDNVVATLRLDDDTIAVVDGTCPAHYGYDARVEILCEKGVLFVGSARKHGCEWITVESGLHGEAVASWRTLFRDAYLAEMESFVDAVLTDRPTDVTGADGRWAVEAVVAINESLRTGQPVPVNGAGVIA
ncbi:MAG: Gfo/Idh/MocA family oxidoreductase [Planctomycetia bacterium]|nr:Gfo/Idh/MocA family oxidoreductase [Planctomycetia bacterium]